MQYDAEEYLDILVTLELAVVNNNGNANAAIRACWQAVRPRVTNDLNRNIFDGVCRQIFARGALCMLRRQLDEVCDG